MTSPITGIDHLLLGLRDLEVARGRYARLGFTLTPRGSHIGWGTANYCIMFERDYIELLGIVDASLFTNNLDKFLARREGLMSLAFGTADAEAAGAALRARDFAVEGPRPLERRLELLEGTVLPRFALLYLPPDALPGLATFLCQHLTPELLRRPEWLRHANGAVAIAALTAVVEQPAALAPAYERLFGKDAVTAEGGRLTVRVGPHEIRFVPSDAACALPDVAPPYLAETVLTSRDLAATAAWFDKQGVAYRRNGGDIVLPPDETHGVWLRFKG
jgi:hypothetical protein